jgi:hypothetical protein
MIIETGTTGIPLREIIKQLGNKSYSYIVFRCKWTDKDGKIYDEFWGSCSYNSKTKELTSFDGDSYSLDDLYDEWKEYALKDVLVVWEHGIVK